MLLQLIFALILPFTSIRAPILNDVQSEHKLEVKEAYRDLGVYGSYNFVNDLTVIPDELNESGSCSLVFEDNTSGNFVSLSTTGGTFTNKIWRLYQLDFEWLNGGPYIDITFYVFDVSSTQFTFRYAYGSYLSQMSSDYQDTIINFNTPFYLNGLDSIVFNTIFTQDDNYLTTSYNGYYNFNLNLSAINQNVAVFGNVSFDNKLYKSFTNKSNGVLGGPYQLLFLGYDLETEGYTWNSYNLPFNPNLTVSQNVFLNGVKMTLSSYNNLSNVGVFSYLRDSSYDDTDFEDLLFTVADTPVYFLSQLLSFELFGMNLFIALAGLITLLIVVFVIKKIKGIF